MTQLEKNAFILELVGMSGAAVLAIYMQARDSGDVDRMLLANSELLSRAAEDIGKGSRN